MEFILDNTGPSGEESIAESQLQALLNNIENITDNINSINDNLDVLETDYNAKKTADESTHTTINRNINNLRRDLNDLTTTISALSNRFITAFLNANNASITKANINRAEIDNLKLNSTLEADVDADNVDTNNLNAASATINNITSNTARISELNVDSLSTEAVSINNADINSINTSNANVDSLKITDKVELNGIDLNQLDLKLTGWTNGYLHKMEIKADGVILIKMQNASIVVSPGNISSNYNKLYAAYETDGVWSIYIDSDLDCQAIVIGDAEINSSLVLKTSVRKNADSNGQPNISNTVKVAVVSSLPRIGQRNMIYVVLGDCAYYCDGQYFYEMASKKRG